MFLLLRSPTVELAVFAESDVTLQLVRYLKAKNSLIQTASPGTFHRKTAKNVALSTIRLRKLGRLCLGCVCCAATQQMLSLIVS
jgi:hypothetical protein